MWLVQCGYCAASWTGYPDDDCDWCWHRDMANDEDERKRLLWPDWSARHNGPKYDALDEASKEVWRKTRGQRTDENAYAVWLHDLTNGVRKGLFTKEDAMEAIRRETE